MTRIAADGRREDTLYRIHGTNEPWTIGRSVSSGCVRMLNQDVIDLYERTPLDLAEGQTMEINVR